MSNSTFINFTNHASDRWGKAQMEAAEKYGEIVDVPFPNVPATATENDIIRLSREMFEKIMSYNPNAVLCQGEFTLTYRIIQLLKEQGITAVSACSERKSIEEKKEDGTVHKSAVFKFIQFREY